VPAGVGQVDGFSDDSSDDFEELMASDNGEELNEEVRRKGSLSGGLGGLAL
jgi:hypothetical protein